MSQTPKTSKSQNPYNTRTRLKSTNYMQVLDPVVKEQPPDIDQVMDMNVPIYQFSRAVLTKSPTVKQGQMLGHTNAMDQDQPSLPKTDSLLTIDSDIPSSFPASSSPVKSVKTGSIVQVLALETVDNVNDKDTDMDDSPDEEPPRTAQFHFSGFQSNKVALALSRKQQNEQRKHLIETVINGELFALLVTTCATCCPLCDGQMDLIHFGESASVRCTDESCCKCLTTTDYIDHICRFDILHLIDLFHASSSFKLCSKIRSPLVLPEDVCIEDVEFFQTTTSTSQFSLIDIDSQISTPILSSFRLFIFKITNTDYKALNEQLIPALTERCYCLLSKVPEIKGSPEERFVNLLVVVPSIFVNNMMPPVMNILDKISCAQTTQFFYSEVNVHFSDLNLSANNWGIGLGKIAREMNLEYPDCPEFTRCRLLHLGVQRLLSKAKIRLTDLCYDEWYTKIKAAKVAPSTTTINTLGSPAESPELEFKLKLKIQSTVVKLQVTMDIKDKEQVGTCKLPLDTAVPYELQTEFGTFFAFGAIACFRVKRMIRGVEIGYSGAKAGGLFPMIKDKIEVDIYPLSKLNLLKEGCCVIPVSSDLSYVLLYQYKSPPASSSLSSLEGITAATRAAIPEASINEDSNSSGEYTIDSTDSASVIPTASFIPAFYDLEEYSVPEFEIVYTKIKIISPNLSQFTIPASSHPAFSIADLHRCIFRETGYKRTQYQLVRNGITLNSTILNKCINDSHPFMMLEMHERQDSEGNAQRPLVSTNNNFINLPESHPTSVSIVDNDGTRIDYTAYPTTTIDDIKNFIRQTLGYSDNYFLSHLSHNLTPTSLRALLTDSHPTTTIDISRRMKGGARSNSANKQNANLDPCDSRISEERDFELRQIPGPMLRDAQGNNRFGGAPRFEEVRIRPPPTAWTSGARTVYSNQVALEQRQKLAQRTKRDLKKAKEARSLIQTQKPRASQLGRKKAPLAIDPYSTFTVSTDQSAPNIVKFRDRVIISDISSPIKRKPQKSTNNNKSTSKRAKKTKAYRKRVYKRPVKSKSNFIGENPSAPGTIPLNGERLQIKHSSGTYIYKWRDGEIVNNVLMFMKIHSGLHGTLHYLFSDVIINNSTAINELDCNTLMYDTSSSTQSAPCSVDDVPIFDSGQTFTKFAVGNIHGLKSGKDSANLMIHRHNIGIFIATECQAKNKTRYPDMYPFFPVVNKEGQRKYGTSIAINNKIYPDITNGDLNKTQSDISATVRFKDFTAIGFYLPKHSRLESLKNILSTAGSTTIMMGDANTNCLQPETDVDHDVMNYLSAQGFHLHLINTDGTFKRISPTQPRLIECSTLDYCFIRDPDGIIHSIKVHALEEALIFSDHKTLVASIVTNTNDLCITAKQSRPRSYKYIPHIVTITKNCRNISIDLNEPHRVKFHEEYRKQLAKKESAIKQAISETDNVNSSDKKRQDARNRTINLMNKCYKTASNISVGYTKHQAAVSSAEIAEIARNQKMGRHDVARSIINNLQATIFTQWKGENAEMDRAGYIKKFGNQRRRIIRANGGHLNPNNVDSLILEWRSKWLLSEPKPKTEILGPLPSVLRPLPPDFTLDSFKRIIADLPNNKSPGLSRVTNEMLKYAPEEATDLLYLIFCSILTTGIIPDSWCNNCIIPVYKNRGDKQSLLFYRPITLMEVLKKVLESILLPVARNHFPGTTDQYGFTRRTSTMDAADKLYSSMNEKRENGTLHLYSSEKWDIKSAFDNICHIKCKQFIETYVACVILRYLFLSLLLVNNVCIAIGSSQSRFYQINRGLLQGSKLSPFFFIGLVDWALKQGPEVIRGLKIIYADDFLILALIADRERNFEIAKKQLALIGLELSAEKSYTITNTDVNVHDKWLGYPIDANGLDVDLHAPRAIAGAETRARMLPTLGAWHGNFKDDPICGVYRSQVISVLEYGLAVYPPNEFWAQKIDIMINKHLRMVLGIPMSYPIDDLRNLFQFGPFFNRWMQLHARFSNHISTTMNSPIDIKFDHKQPWSFKTRPSINKLIQEGKISRKFLLRLGAPPSTLAVCSKCGEHHKTINHHMQCYMKGQQFLIPKLHKLPPVENPKWYAEAVEIQHNLLINNQLDVVNITVDSGFEMDEDNFGHSNSGAVIITHNSITTQQFDQSRMVIKDSTRAEVCGLTSICKQFTGKELRFFCDSKPALDLCEEFLHYQENDTCFEHINHCDIICQGKWFENTIVFNWVKGHAANNLNNECDRLTSQSFHPVPVDLQICSQWPVTAPVPRNPTYWRIRQLIFAAERKRLDPSFFEQMTLCALDMDQASLGLLDPVIIPPNNSIASSEIEKLASAMPARTSPPTIHAHNRHNLIFSDSDSEIEAPDSDDRPASLKTLQISISAALQMAFA